MSRSRFALSRHDHHLNQRLALDRGRAAGGRLVVLFLLVSVLLILRVPGQSHAAPLATEDVPKPLQPWINWVLHGHEQTRCPFLYNNGDQHRCNWPSPLVLSLHDQGGSFSQDWQMLIDGWIPLPGDQLHWPQQLQLNDAPAVVSERQGRPSLYVKAGHYTLKGQFAWSHLPKAVSIPPETGLVQLHLNTVQVEFPELDATGRLWLQRRLETQTDPQPEADRLDLVVARHIVDDIPLLMTTRINLDVAGQAREVLLGYTMSPQALPLSLQSPLPVRLEPDGRLRVQVRPGRWHILLTVRYASPVSTLTLDSTGDSTGDSTDSRWVDEEVWVFEARHQLRLVTLEGPPPLDPQQTTLPDAWRRFPAYRMQPGNSLKLTEKRRGDPEPMPDRLRLMRHWWLDFDGGGYTIQDRISGTMSSGWRLELEAPAQLGRVGLDGKDQFITRLDGSDRVGVEMRRGKVDLVADSRLNGYQTSMSAVGWVHDFHRVNGLLHLPPGWRVLHVSGADQVPNTWFHRWTLLDLFLVLFMSVAIGRLWGRRWGALAFITLILAYHEPGAPQWSWLNILAAIALLRVLPSGRAAQVVRAYRNLSVLLLIVITLPFMIHQVRQGLYPQLENWGRSSWPLPMLSFDSQIAARVEPETPMSAPGDRSVAQSKKRSATLSSRDSYRAELDKSLLQYDPKAHIQTGPGLPQWKWHQVALNWRGPVQREQQIRLFFIPPWANRLLSFLRVLLLCALFGRILDWRDRQGRGEPVQAAGAVAVLCLFSLVASGPRLAHADVPSPQLLDELRTRLLAPADCLPQCATSPRLAVVATPATLRLRVEVHTLEAVAVPLPGQAEQWLPQTILLDGIAAAGLVRTKGGHLWLSLPPGQHQLLLEGPLPDRNIVQLSLPLKPHRVESKIAGWRLAGVHENGVPDSRLQLNRLRPETAKTEKVALASTQLPPFVSVERTLTLGLTWQVNTLVRRVSPTGSAIVILIPLLEGESVTSDAIRVENGQVSLSFNPEQSQLSWTSVFKPRQDIRLTAPETVSWTERWRLLAGPIWHVDPTGIPVIFQQAPSDNWLPEWRPWPGESVTLLISRPAGVTGQTVTIDRSNLVVEPGQRVMNSTLSLTMRSSRGGQHRIHLPPQSSLQDVRIDGQSQPIRLEGQSLILPLVPAAQKIDVKWQQPTAILMRLQTPAVDLGIESVNAQVQVRLPYDRWMLYVGGPALGPAVLFWAVLMVMILMAIGLSRSTLTPLKARHWILLGLGLAPVSFGVGLAVLVFGWLLALGWRERLSAAAPTLKFNLIQVGLVLLTLFALGALLGAIAQDLLGHPDMQIGGNGSSRCILQWYQDRATASLPQAWILSVPLVVYRAAMLVWSLWLAFALLRWLRWAWTCFSTNGLWRPIRQREAPAAE